MKRFKPFTPHYDKKKVRTEFRYNRMKELAEINWDQVGVKEKYGRMDYFFPGAVSELLEETMNDYERLSEESCMYCNKHCKQFWTRRWGWLIHLCLPCYVLDKITNLLEKIIHRWRKRNDRSGWYTSYTCSG